jgi:hypothetical protein
MIEIWPAGPPKLMKPSLSQNRKASRKVTLAGRGAVIGGRWRAGTECRSGAHSALRTPPCNDWLLARILQVAIDALSAVT